MAKKISALPVKAKVRDPLTKYNGVAIGWIIGDKSHSGYPGSSVTLVAERILTLKCFDAIESGGGNSRDSYGNNRYIYANIRQWLNKRGTGWYAQQHGYDRPPSNAYVWSNYNEYDAEAGFKTGFSAEFLAAILPTTLIVAKPSCDGGGSETLTDDIFLLSMAEVGLGSENGIAEGSILAMFSSDNASRKCMPTAQAVSKSEYTSSSLTASQPWWWWLRSPRAGNGCDARSVHSDGTLSHVGAYDGRGGVRPALNLSSEILVSDTPDSEGYYTIIWNNAPTTPPGITVPETVRSGKGLAVSWAASMDSDGDAVSYELERQYNGGAWSKVYDGAATQYTDNITTAMNTVAYRVLAKDSRGGRSGYTTSLTRTVIHNADPTVSGSDQALGVVTTPPSFTYTVGDVDTGDTLEVVEMLDGQEVRTIEEAVRGQQYTFALSEVQFAGLKGEHTMKVKVTDSAGNSATRTITFSRSVSCIDLDWKMDDTSAAAEKILVSLRYLAADSAVQLQVCNNFNDASPAWEDANSGRKHIFSNKAKTAESWAVGVRVKIQKTPGFDTIALYSISGSYI